MINDGLEIINEKQCHNNLNQEERILDYFFHFSYELYHNVSNMNFEQLRVFNHCILKPGMTEYPYTDYNFESIYFVLEGDLTYKDSYENHDIIGFHELFAITSGKGISYNIKNNSLQNKLFFIQMGFFPDKKSIQSRWQKHKLITNNHLNKIYPLVEPIKSGTRHSIRINQNVVIYFSIMEAGKEIILDAKNHNYYLYVIKGILTVNNKFKMKYGDSCKIFIQISEDILLENKEQEHDIELLLVEMR